MLRHNPGHASPVRGRLSLDQVAHLAFFLIVGIALVRLSHLDRPLCWDMAALSGLLAVVYTLGLARPDRRGAPSVRRCWVGALLVLWTLLVVLTPAVITGAYAWLGVPLACVAPRMLDRRAAAVALAVIMVVLAGGQLAAGHPVTPESVVIPLAAVALTVTLYLAQQRDAEERQRLVEELRSTRDVLAEQQRRAGVLAERERIARDLHDSLAQELAGSLMMLQATERNWPQRPDVARARVRAVADGLSAGLAETRRIIQDLAPSAIAERGLVEALRLLCARAEQDGTGARVRFGAVGIGEAVVADQAAAALFRVAQSVLANVRDHAHAINVTVTLSHHNDHVELAVCDDGAGFDPGTVVPRPGHGFGLPLARTRLRDHGGDLAVTSEPGRGAQVRARVPARAVAAVPASAP